MNAESFANLLKEYSNLYQLPMEELRTMVMQYPYCHNLQVLLQEKAELDQHPDREKTLAKAATYAIDRKQLYKRLKLMREKKAEPKAEASYHLGEDFLELKDLTSVQADLEKIALGTYEDPSTTQTMAIEPEPPSSIDSPASTEPGLNSSWNGSWDGANDDLDEDISLEIDSLDFTLNPISNPAPSVASDIAVELKLNTDTLTERRTVIIEARKRAGSLWHPNSKTASHTVGSFFRNPVVSNKQLEFLMKFEEFGQTTADIRAMNKAHGGDETRVSAAHVLLAAGFYRGQDWGTVKLNDYNLLKIEALPGASAQAIYDISKIITDTCSKRLKINLEPEARILGNFD